MAKRFIGNVKGVSITAFSWEYYLSSSKTVLDGGSWSESPPTLGNNKYLWMRSKVTLSDSTIQYTTPICEGVWEEIYGIYAEGEKIDGALSDITDLKTRMTAEENKVQPLDKGGTGATTAAAAREAILENKALSIAQGGTGKTTAADALKALGGASIKRVYSNASPGSAFPAQTVSNNMGGYSKYFVLFGYGQSPCALAIVEKNKKTLCYGVVSAAAQRTITINENNFAVTIGEMISGEWQTNNNVMVPLEIYGMEGVL